MRNNYFQQLKEVEKNFLKQLCQQLFVFFGSYHRLVVPALVTQPDDSDDNVISCASSTVCPSPPNAPACSERRDANQSLQR
jgi:hypothetical protein